MRWWFTAKIDVNATQEWILLANGLLDTSTYCAIECCIVVDENSCIVALHQCIPKIIYFFDSTKLGKRAYSVEVPGGSIVRTCYYYELLLSWAKRNSLSKHRGNVRPSLMRSSWVWSGAFASLVSDVTVPLGPRISPSWFAARQRTTPVDLISHRTYLVAPWVWNIRNNRAQLISFKPV